MNTRKKFLVPLAVLACAALLIGCGKSANDAEVVSAIAASAQVKTRAFNGSMTMGSGDQSMEMTFDGAIDGSDPAKPKMRFSMKGEGSDTTMVMPGDGRFYVTMGDQAYYSELPAGQTKKQTVDPSAVFAALQEAVSSFKEAPQPLTDAQGKQVPTMTATVSKDKLCGSVLDALGSALSGAGGMGGDLDGLKLGEGGVGELCESMLKSDPRVWIGIVDGRATDVALSAKLDMMGLGTSKVEVTYHEFNQDKKQTGFDVPAGAKPMPSPDQLGGSTASTSGSASTSSF